MAWLPNRWVERNQLILTTFWTLNHWQTIIEKNGAFGIVLECTYSDISKKISNLIKIPTIGIGASVYCDGQVLVTDDIIGLTDAKIKFVKKYVDIKKIINSAVLKFKQEVKSKKYPTKKYSY